MARKTFLNMSLPPLVRFGVLKVPLVCGPGLSLQGADNIRAESGIELDLIRGHRRIIDQGLIGPGQFTELSVLGGT